jgi:hypothetical protein
VATVKTSDQFQVSALQEYSGSYLDHVYYGSIFSNNPTTYSSSIDPFVTESIDPFQRSVIYSKATGNPTDSLKKRNILYSDRLKYKSGESFGGSRTSNMFMPVLSFGEQYFDSFLPSPLDIGKANGVFFGFLPGQSGSLNGSTNFGLPAAAPSDIPILFGNSVPPSLSNISGAIDTQWLRNPYPFQTKYKNINRKTNTSFTLSEKQNVEIDLSTGAFISPVSQSDSLGTVYYVSEEEIVGNTNVIYEGEYNSTEIATFTETTWPSVVPQTVSFSGSHSHDFPGAPFGFQSEAQKVLFGTEGTIIRRQEGSPSWNLVQTGEPYTLHGAANSRGANSSGFVQFGHWVFVGSDGTIRRSERYNLIDNIPLKPTSSGVPTLVTFYDVAFQSNAGASSGRFVAVGSGGEVQYSTNFSGSNWVQHDDVPFGSGTTLRAIDYNPFTSTFIAVGDAVSGDTTIWYSTPGDPTAAWTPVVIGGLAGANLHTVRCSYRSNQTIVAGTSGSVAMSEDGGATWWWVAGALSGYTGTLRGSARATSTVEGVVANFYLVGDNGAIYTVGGDSGSGAASGLVTENPDNSSNQYNTITSYDVWPSPLRSWPTDGDLTIAGESYEVTKNAIGRVVDVESTGYSYSEENLGFINSGESIELGGSGLSSNSVYTRSKLEDMNKVFFGFGKGTTITIPNTFTPSTINYMPGSAVDFYDKKFVVADSQIEFFRFVGPKPLGFRYGIYNVNPSTTKCVFRRNKFGQPRDMLEQRQLSKFFVIDPTTGKTAVTPGPVVVQFVSGTTSWERARTYATASLETSFNKKDSGVYDYEYRSGQPFFDDQIGLVD